MINNKIGEMLLIDQPVYGDEDQNELMYLINSYEGDRDMENKIEGLLKEVELYKQAIQDAKDALASAEQELDETLDAVFENQ